MKTKQILMKHLTDPVRAGEFGLIVIIIFFLVRQYLFDQLIPNCALTDDFFFPSSKISVS